MKFLALFSGVVAASASAAGMKNKDIERVVGLLEEMKDEATLALNNADAAQAKDITRLSLAIANAKEAHQAATSKSDAAAAASAAAGSASVQADSEIAAAVDMIKEQKGEKKTKKGERATELGAHTAQLEDADAGITACTRLLGNLENIKDQSTAGFFLQEKMKSMPNLGRAKVLMQAVEKFNRPQVVYKQDESFKAIVDMIETLKAELETDRTEIMTEEANRLNAYNLNINACNNLISNKEKEKRNKEDERAKQDGIKGDEEMEFQAQKAEADAQGVLEGELSGEMTLAEEHHKDAVEARAAEIDAIEKAVTILNENEAETATQKTFLQITRAINEDGKSKALDFLRKQASKLHSKSLLMITEAASEDPFTKVKGLIQKLIARLEAEHTAAATKHAECKSKMTNNENDIKSTQSSIVEQTIEIALRTNAITGNTLAKEEANEAIRISNAEKDAADKSFFQRTAELDETISVGKATHTALDQAVAALSTGVTAANAGGPRFGGTEGMGTIVNFLKNIQEKQMVAIDQAVEELVSLDNTHGDSTVDRKEAVVAQQKLADDAHEAVVVAKDLKSQAESALANANTDMEGFKGLKRDIDGECIAQGASHEENQEKRRAEIQSLEEALNILTDAN